ncbi:hypothetical protein [Acinetobacter johnsonii]|uniref:Uncharacterized protein n=1 Tax=Acinetobacter johnsonii TaxID=40214 RepID=A0A380TS81_ACIJO|nr:hypothetical protein [Acinetobacter johnsonii]ENU40011.1 hypothetical protein F986_01139 [Acinetobacter johnsonii CIP 64.6]QPS02862.1 hypothetical protein I6G67_11500 [Acinetobacter johnsonii]SUT91214.1 Uncharacterised protein [Acinetobacter johnsonii]
MNLIEQLGGYEYLNGFYKRAVAHGFTLTEIKEELLKYRRQHNIFEVGDKVVFTNNPCALNHSVWQVISNKDYPVVAPICNFNGRVIVEANMSVLSPYRIQHAEDEEIKAGKRLEVK